MKLIKVDVIDNAPIIFNPEYIEYIEEWSNAQECGIFIQLKSGKKFRTRNYDLIGLLDEMENN